MISELKLGRSQDALILTSTILPGNKAWRTQGALGWGWGWVKALEGGLTCAEGGRDIIVPRCLPATVTLAKLGIPLSGTVFPGHCHWVASSYPKLCPFQPHESQ